MKKWLRRWLGIEALEQKFISLLVGMGRLTPEQAEELVATETQKDYRLINNHGEEGQL